MAGNPRSPRPGSGSGCASIPTGRAAPASPQHFGSWSKALQAAGLIERSRQFDEPVAERVAIARRLRAQGHTIRAIAEQLGVSISTVHNYLRAGSCPQCGGPVASPRAERCVTCTAHEPSVERSWSRGRVRDAIRAWAKEHGSPPSYHQWTPSRTHPDQREADSPRWPSAAVVCDAYDEYRNPWNAALIDAGAQVRFQRWSDEATRDALADFSTRTGRAPEPADLSTTSWHGPTTRTLRRRYGGIERAWQTLGAVPTGIADTPEI